MRTGDQAAFDSRFRMLAPVVDQTFDLRAVLAASVGSNWAGVSPDQQGRLLDAFRRYTIASYVPISTVMTARVLPSHPTRAGSMQSGWS
jgi:phospholipid transport system substrate-binding protein